MSNAELIDSVEVKPKFPKSVPSFMLDPICDWSKPDWEDRFPGTMLTMYWFGTDIMPRGDGEGFGRN